MHLTYDIIYMVQWHALVCLFIVRLAYFIPASILNLYHTCLFCWYQSPPYGGVIRRHGTKCSNRIIKSAIHYSKCVDTVYYAVKITCTNVSCSLHEMQLHLR